MNDSYRMCHMTPRINVELDDGNTADLTLGDCMRVINQLMYHRFIQIEVSMPKDGKLGPHGVEQWEHIHLHAPTDGCWQYEDDLDCLTITVEMNDETLIGGLPREEFRNLPKKESE